MAKLVDLDPKGGQPQAAPVASALSQLTKEANEIIDGGTIQTLADLKQSIYQLRNYLCLSKSDNSRNEMTRSVDLVPKASPVEKKRIRATGEEVPFKKLKLRNIKGDIEICLWRDLAQTVVLKGECVTVRNFMVTDNKNIPVSAITNKMHQQQFRMCDDDIQIRADRQELQQFHHLVIRPVTPIFNPLGQYCQVRRCCSLSKYSTLRELHTHWKYLHQPNRQIYKCGKCQKMFWIKSRCFRHISFKHYAIKDNIHNFINTIVPPNVYYIENRGTMLPRLGTAVENSEFINQEKSEASSSSSNRVFGGCRDYGEKTSHD
ncbi:Hypothetical predicted protein [Mytilus galloprovincialis]|uniref:C2H2-type domain-containing protein n=1 Tax=Mytilus galloprovincialis TaxID=29158 RepID=A0A8B6HSM2_MYTGA|nr:Hypothetical predicted protein [Mytilus galloprovincialis]